jgi:type IV secretion system protein VirB10
MRWFVCLLAAAGGFAAEIPSGTHVLLRLQNTVNSRTAKVGDYVYLATATPIVTDGGIAVPLGSYVQGVVAMVERAGRVKGRAELAIRLETLTLPSGRRYRLEPRVASIEGDADGQQVVDRENTVQQGSTVGQDAGQVAILAGSGAALGAMVGRIGNGGALRGAGIGAGAGAAVGLATVLLTRGKDVDLRQGSTIDVVLDRPVTLD